MTVISFTGASTFPGLRKFIAEKSQTRVLSLLHIAAHGLASAGCTSSGMRDSLEIFQECGKREGKCGGWGVQINSWSVRDNSILF